jgi:hypothetical protein
MLRDFSGSISGEYDRWTTNLFAVQRMRAPGKNYFASILNFYFIVQIKKAPPTAEPFYIRACALLIA